MQLQRNCCSTLLWLIFFSLDAVKRILLICLGLLVAVFAGAILFGGPRTPQPVASINDPFSSVDFSDLPPVAQFTARDRTQFSYRHYPSTAATPGEVSVVLVHGSSATSSSMHPMAKTLSARDIQFMPWTFVATVVPVAGARSPISDSSKTTSPISCMRFRPRSP